MNSNKTHTSSIFEEDLQQLNEMIHDLGGLARKQLRSSIKALSDYQLSKIDKLIERDQKLDRLEVQIARKAAEVISLRSPRAGDLRRVLVVSNSATIFERVGDYARNTGHRIKAIMAMPNDGLPLSDLAKMGLHVEQMITDVLCALDECDVDVALQVRSADVNVDEMHTTLYRSMVTLMQERPALVPAGVHVMFIAKNYERMGDYATSVAEQIHYMVKNELPETRRPKADHTSWLLDDA